ncbi:MAG: FtsH protease activity modulator HflK [Pseudomonadota bacterium]
MPWNNQNGGGSRGNGNGPWGSGGGGGGGPWGGGPSRGGGGGGNPPDLEELLRKSQQRLKNVLPGGGRGPTSGANRALIGIAVIIGVLFAGYYFFTFRVQPDEEGVVLRFGEFNRQAQPGLNFRLPYPIEDVYLPKVTRVNRITVGYRSGDDNRAGRAQDIPEESLMLTGDENIVDIDFTILWRISDAANFLFNIRDPEGTVKVVAESAMREVVGRTEIQPLLTQARQVTEADVQQLMQTTLDLYSAGIIITQVQLQQVDPPRQVIDAFRDVQAARADQERAQNEAQAYANKVVPEARGEAARILEAANAYREQTVAEANGQAARFSQVYEEYRKAPDVTRQRMYLETMERVFGGSDKIIIDSPEGGSGVIPYLPLDQLNRRQGATQ